MAKHHPLGPVHNLDGSVMKIESVGQVASESSYLTSGLQVEPVYWLGRNG